MFDKNTLRAMLRKQDHVTQKTAAQHKGEATVAEQAREQATANVKFKALLTKSQEEREALSDKVTGLEANITELQRLVNRAHAAAHAVSKESAAAVCEFEAQEQVDQQTRELSASSKKVAKERQ
eukprot:6213358-Pleurochrysis_carterae.AAC.7